MAVDIFSLIDKDNDKTLYKDELKDLWWAIEGEFIKQ